MYTSTNFKTKKELRAAVDAYNEGIVLRDLYVLQGKTVNDAIHLAIEEVKKSKGIRPSPIIIFTPGLGTPKTNGWDTVEGPYFHQPHRWHAQVEMKDGIVVKVK